MLLRMLPSFAFSIGCPSRVPDRICPDLWRTWLDQLAIADSLPQACDRMLGLKATCIHPTSKEHYIKSSTGGVNNSPEGAAVSRQTEHRILLFFPEHLLPIYYGLTPTRKD